MIFWRKYIMHFHQGILVFHKQLMLSLYIRVSLDKAKIAYLAWRNTYFWLYNIITRKYRKTITSMKPSKSEDTTKSSLRRKKRRKRRKCVRSLYVTGLPLNCKPRDVHMAFRGFVGYERSVLLTRTSTAGKCIIKFLCEA